MLNIFFGLWIDAFKVLNKNNSFLRNNCKISFNFKIKTNFKRYNFIKFLECDKLFLIYSNILPGIIFCSYYSCSKFKLKSNHFIKIFNYKNKFFAAHKKNKINFSLIITRNKENAKVWEKSLKCNCVTDPFADTILAPTIFSSFFCCLTHMRQIIRQ